MNNVTIVNIPDKKEGLFIDGLLVYEDRFISTFTVLSKLTERELIHGQVRYANESDLTDSGQFPTNLCNLKLRENRF